MTDSSIEAVKPKTKTKRKVKAVVDVDTVTASTSKVSNIKTRVDPRDAIDSVQLLRGFISSIIRFRAGIR